MIKYLINFRETMPYSRVFCIQIKMYTYLSQVLKGIDFPGKTHLIHLSMISISNTKIFLFLRILNPCTPHLTYILFRTIS